MPAKELKRVEVLTHTDGRRWVRIGGSVVLNEAPGRQLAVEALAQMFYRKIGGTVAQAGASIQLALACPILHSHPQFVGPYEGK